jgi:hypothetical protein
VRADSRFKRPTWSGDHQAQRGKRNADAAFGRVDGDFLEVVPGLPTDEQLNAAVKAAGFTRCFLKEYK